MDKHDLLKAVFYLDELVSSVKTINAKYNVKSIQTLYYHLDNNKYLITAHSEKFSDSIPTWSITEFKTLTDSITYSGDTPLEMLDNFDKNIPNEKI